MNSRDSLSTRNLAPLPSFVLVRVAGTLKVIGRGCDTQVIRTARRCVSNRRVHGKSGDGVVANQSSGASDRRDRGVGNVIAGLEPAPKVEAIARHVNEDARVCGRVGRRGPPSGARARAPSVELEL
jgi:hypothetical protein